MATPRSRQEFKNFCLRALGDGIIKINLTADQIDDRVDEALTMWREFHFNATTRAYLRKQITEEDIANKYIVVPENVIEVVKILPISNTFGNALFSALHYAKYMFHWNFNFGIGFGQVHGYDIALQNLETLDEQLGQKIGFRFNRYDDKLHLITDWELFNVGDYVVYEAFLTEDADELWGDIWLQRYATQLMKRNWGEVLGKYQNVQLLGGISYNGDQIRSQAEESIAKLEDELMNRWTLLPLGFLA